MNTLQILFGVLSNPFPYLAMLMNMPSTLVIGGEPKKEIDIIPQLFPHLQNLSQLFLDAVGVDPLHDAIQHNPTTTFIGSMFCMESGSSDLTNVVLGCAKIHHGNNKVLDSHLALGMQVRQLITSPTVLDGSFGARNFRGLCELEIIMGASLIVLPWLSEFTNAHPQLQKIRFTNYRREYFKHNDTIEFLLPFLEDLRREELTECMDIKGFSVTRTPNSASPYRHWHVTGLFLWIVKWSDRVMYLAHSRFPYICTLTIEHGCTPVVRLSKSLLFCVTNQV